MTAPSVVRPIALILMLALPACFFPSSSDSEGDGVLPGQDTSTDAPALGEESSLGLPRLSRDEYVATLGDVLAETVPSLGPDLMRTIEPTLRSLPVDQLLSPPAEKHGGFSRLDQSQQQQYADVPFQVAAAIGRETTATPERRTALLGACAAAAVDKPCLAAFVRRFGEVTSRRPLEDSDVAFYLEGIPDTNVSADSIASVVTQLLSSPRFLYHVESGTEAAGGADIFALDAWELASRLSYHFWGTMPDAALREAARSGALLDPAGYNAQVDRLFADPRVNRTMESFFTQWFWPLLALPALDSRLADPTFRAFAGANAPSPELRDRMVQEVIDSAVFVAKNGGTLRDLLQNRQSFARDAELAAIYHVPVWDGVAPPPEMPPERVGLLTRAAFLTTGTANTRPIMKGVFIRTTLLCDEIPPPPQEAMAVAINLSPELSTRQVVEQLTETNGSCAGCHKTLINPLGFASENFDSLGRARTAQTLFDAAGTVVGQAPIDTRTTPRIDDKGVSSGIGELTTRLVDSGKIEACFAERYFRFTFRRIEATSGDRTLIEVMARTAREGGPLATMLKTSAQRPEFKRKRFPQ